jgi:hypothetical protein
MPSAIQEWFDSWGFILLYVKHVYTLRRDARDTRFAGTSRNLLERSAVSHAECDKHICTLECSEMKII